MNKTRLKSYARLIAKCGVNVQKGQRVFIYAELDQPEFVRLVAEECYKLGAAKVNVFFSYQPLSKLSVRYQKDEVLGKMDEWDLTLWEEQTKILPCKIYLMSDDPDGMKGINQKKFAKAQAARSKVIKPLRDKMENKYQWCIAAVPGEAWAKKVFPGMRKSAAMEKLWEAILDTSRVWEDPIAEWDRHNQELSRRCAYLNGLNIRQLRYKAGNGTDFRVGMIPGALFCAGGETTIPGVYFNPNIPSEEVFISPMRGEAEGIVYSSRPLSCNGQLVDNFWFRFEGGKVVDCGAEQGEQTLRELIAMDEGASYLGECALVPYTSPIRESGILFYNTLFDENAACHLALGHGFSNVLPGYETRPEEQAREMGINDSVIHEDFMIGTADMDITAVTADGQEVPIFRGGEWAFEV